MAGGIPARAQARVRHRGARSLSSGPRDAAYARARATTCHLIRCAVRAVPGAAGRTYGTPPAGVRGAAGADREDGRIHSAVWGRSTLQGGAWTAEAPRSAGTDRAAARGVTGPS